MRFATAGDGNRVSSSASPMLDAALMPSRSESRWLSWGRSAFATAIAVALIALGIANIATRARWNEVEDGVDWDPDRKGSSPLKSRGLVGRRPRGDCTRHVLIAVNGQPGVLGGDVFAFLRRRAQECALIPLLRLVPKGLDIALDLRPTARGIRARRSLLFTGSSASRSGCARPRERRPCSSSGWALPFRRVHALDSRSFRPARWSSSGRAVAMARLTPLMLHVTLVFPDRPIDRRAAERTLCPSDCRPRVVVSRVRSSPAAA